VTASVLAYIPSPSQGVWHLGPVPLRAYALCIIVGIVAALIIGDRRWAERGGERGVIYDIALWAVPFGLIGGRLYHVMTDWRTYFGDDGAGFIAAFKIWDGGLGIWGAVALGGVGAWIGCRQHGIPLPAFGDAIAPGIVLAQAIGRLGNYFNQELYGRPTTLPWGLEIFERRNTAGALDSLNGVSTGQLVEVVHPTFLYELLWNVLVFVVLILVDRRFKIGHGRLFALYVAAYCVGRFWVELMRSDMATHIAGIRVNTFTSTFVFIAAVVYIMVAPKGREDPATLRGKAFDDEHTPVDELGEELTAVAATSGVVAAAKVAGDEDKRATTPASVGHGGAVESEAAAEAEDLTEQVATAPSEDIAEAEAFAAAGAAADAEPDAGLGSVEGDEAVEAETAAPEVHEAAVDAAEDAEALAEDVATNAESEGAESFEPEPEVAVGPEPEVAPEEDLGSVEGDEVGEAQDDAPEVLAAVEGTAVVEALAAEPETAEPETGEPELAEPEVDSDSAEPEPEGAGPETEVAEAQDAPAEALAGEGTAAAEALTAEPAAESGGEEAVESEPEAAAEAESEDLSEQVATAPEPAPDAEPEPEDGLGSVEVDEVAEAQQDAAEVHEATAEGADEAEVLADDVADEPETAEPDTAAAAASTRQPERESPRRRWWRRRG
jgi:prolipoprotein diacylglyceryl transferase